MKHLCISIGIVGFLWTAIFCLSSSPVQAAWGATLGSSSCTLSAGGANNLCPSPQDVCDAWGEFYGGGCVSVDGPVSGTSGIIIGYYYTYRYGINNYQGASFPICDYPSVADALSPSGCTAFTPPPPKQLGDPNCNTGCGTLVGNPINALIGNKLEKVVDYESAGTQKLSFIRHYNSQSRYFSSIGFGWQSNYDRQILLGGQQPANAYSLYVVRPDGARYAFTKGANGWSPAADPDVDGSLATDGSTVWTYTDSEDTIETFDFSSGRLLSIKNRDGYTQVLAYDTNGQLVSVTDAYNRQLIFTFTDGTLQTMTDPDGNVYTYTYDNVVRSTPDRLIQVSPPGTQNPVIQYLYENTTYPYALTGIVDENGNRAATWTYDANMRATSSQHNAGADLTTVDYNLNSIGTGSVTVTNALRKQSVYTLNYISGVGKTTNISGQVSANTPATQVDITYDSRGYIASRTDENGNTVTYSNDPRGLPLTVTEAVGSSIARTKTLTWDPTFHLPTQIVEAGKTTSFIYSAQGLLLSRTETDTATGTVPYSTNGQSRTLSYTYTTTGQLATVTGPRTDVQQTTQYTYGTTGYLSSVINALNQVTQITSVNGRGLPLTIIDPNGVHVDLAYSSRGWLTSRTVRSASGDAVTSFQYDNIGQITQVALPDGSTLNYTYNAARRLTRVSDGSDQRIDYSLDAMGNRTEIDIHTAGGAALARTQTQVFDELGRLLKNIGASNQTTTLAYDDDGNVVSRTDPLSRVTRQAFDSLNRLISSTDPANSVTTYSYDGQDRITQITDARGLSTSYIYDGFGNLSQLTSPDTGTTVYHYDLAGNRIDQTDASGVVVQYSYDALDRLTAKSFPAGSSKNVAYHHDEASAAFGIGRLTSLTDSSGSTAFTYDTRGNTTQELRVIGGISYTTQYSYNLADRLVGIVYPSGRIVSIARNAIGDVTGLETQANSSAPVIPIVSNGVHLPFGPVTSLAYGNGLQLTKQYDLDYRITSLTNAGTSNSVQSLTYGYDGANHINSITDNHVSGRSQSFQFDSLYRLTQAQGVYGTIGYSYDAVGNRLSQSLVSGSSGFTETYTYGTGSNQLQTVIRGTFTRSFSYTQQGNVANDNRSDGTSVGFVYNQNNRLAEATTLAGLPIANYVQNAFGQRVIKTLAGTPAVTTHYQFDRSGRLLAESDSQGNVQQEYLWLDDLPVATFSNGQPSFIGTDHLPTPQAMTDGQQNLVWDVAFQPFGQPEQLTATRTNNLRFPGQHFDAESSISYNYYRDYDQTLGRYIQSDPIGLKGGINPYAYVSADPVNNLDPDGLSCTSSGGTLSCSYPGGPSFKVPAPSRFPANLNSNTSTYHNYHLSDPLGCANPSNVQNNMMNHPTPGPSSNPATPGGTQNAAALPFPGNFLGPNNVTSYQTTDENTGNQMVVNVTNDGSVLDYGYVAQEVSNGSLNIYGEGDSGWQSPSYGRSGFQNYMNNNVWGPLMNSDIGGGGQNCGCNH